MFSENPQALLALDYINHSQKHIFLTGKAGTGKTTFLKNLQNLVTKNKIIVAPTGVAALNAEGVTIHSFFQLRFSPFIPELANNDHNIPFNKKKIDIIQALELLIIDEISMVRADTLDAIDSVLRKFKDPFLPFGGVQLLMIGDLQQLPPVYTEKDREILQNHYDNFFFFGSKVLQETDFVTVELEKIYRQSDPNFINILNAVRNNDITDEMLQQLNQRVQYNSLSEKHIILTTHNQQAKQINYSRLYDLPTPIHIFKARTKGIFPENIYPNDFELELKVGTKIIFIKNDTSEQKHYYNGKLGRITNIIPNKSITVVDEYQNEIVVKPVVWTNITYELNAETQCIQEREIGQFKQLPIKSAWAITIHKSQGLSFDNIIIEGQHAFAHGQIYVALSRCRSLEGLILNRPILRHNILINEHIAIFNRSIKKT